MPRDAIHCFMDLDTHAERFCPFPLKVDCPFFPDFLENQSMAVIPWMRKIRDPIIRLKLACLPGNDVDHLGLSHEYPDRKLLAGTQMRLPMASEMISDVLSLSP